MKILRLLNKIILAVTVSSLFCGCASFETKLFRTEKLAVDTTYGGVKAFNQFYFAYTNTATADQRSKLESAKTQIYTISRNVGAAASVAENFRLTYKTNATEVNKQAWQVAVNSLLINSSNIMVLVKTYSAGGF